MSGEGSTALTLDLKQLVASMGTQVDQLRQTAQLPAWPASPGIQQGLVQLSGSLQRISRQVAQLEDDHATLLAFTDIGQVVNSSLELNAVLEIVMDTIVQLTGSERGFLMLKEGVDDQTKLTMQIARNWEKVSLDSSEYAISQTVIERVVTTGEPVLTTNAQEDPRFGGQQSIISYNLRSILCVPLKVKDEITGVIYADNRIRTGIFTEAKRNLLAAFANQAAVAIENARLFASVRKTLAEVTALKNLMDNVLSSITSGVITSDIDDRVLLCNRAAASILGISRADLVGQSLSDILPEIASDLPERVSDVRNRDGALEGLQYDTNLANRGPVTLRLNMAPLKDAGNQTQGVAIVMEDLTERKRLEGLRRLFERMVSPVVIRQLNPDKLQLGGQRAQITTLFADLRGYTTFGEKYDPEQLVSVLNRYLSAAAGAILENEGTIDKFAGDAVMAWFNAPIPQADHTLRAVRAAVAMVKAVQRLHCEMEREFHLLFGVGIHYGDAVLGLVGNEMRLDYTAIGDSINTAKRLQENALGGQILISNDAYRLVADQVEVRVAEPVLAKGKTQPVQVFEVLGLRT